MVAAQSLATSISLTWDQLQGAEAVDGFEITYSYAVRECISDGDNRPFLPGILRLNSGSRRSYTIMNSSYTPIEEDSDYTITIRAVNSVGMSAQSNTAMTRTANAGECFCVLINSGKLVIATKNNKLLMCKRLGIIYYNIVRPVVRALLLFSHSSRVGSISQSQFRQCYQHHNPVGPCELSSA